MLLYFYVYFEKNEKSKEFKAWSKVHCISKAEMFPFCITVHLLDTTVMNTYLFILCILFSTYMMYKGSHTGVWLKASFCFSFSISVLQWSVCCLYGMCSGPGLSSCWPLGLSLEQIFTLGWKVNPWGHPVSVKDPSTISDSPGAL